MLLLLLQRNENRHSCGSWRSTRNPEKTVDSCLKRASALQKPTLRVREREQHARSVNCSVAHALAPILIHALERRLCIEVIQQKCARVLLSSAVAHRRAAVHG
jgi:hypothetical protein